MRTDSLSAPPLFHSLLNQGWQPELQRIEIATALQIPSFHIVGLPSPEVAEARERVRAAIEASGMEFPRRRVVVNLSPASVRKQGTGLDLALALAILWNDADLKREGPPVSWVVWGELGLDGSLRGTGQLMRLGLAAWKSGARFLLVPAAEEEQLREKLSLLARAGECAGPPPDAIGVSSLNDAWELLRTGGKHARSRPAGATPSPGRVPMPSDPKDSALLPLPPSLARILGACASGRHHLMLLGPRGTGKSQALEWLVRIQPEPSAGTLVTQTTLAELADPCSDGWGRLPVRRIGLNARPAALLGQLSGTQSGRASLRPGEFSRAHGGLLLADEFPEWTRDTRECLREPLERGRVTLSRALGTVELPADFQLAATGNLCPCGGWPPDLPLPEGASAGGFKRCRCSPLRRDDYLARLSGPVMDRIDCVARLLRLPVTGSADAGSVAKMRACVDEARGIAARAWGSPAGLLASSSLESLLRSHSDWRCRLEDCASASLRSRHKILRLALSLAAWDGEALPGAAHFAEAASYRPERFGLGI